MSYQTPDNDIFDYLRAELSRMNAKLDRLSEDLSDIKRGMREDAAGLIRPDTKFRVPRPSTTWAESRPICWFIKKLRHPRPMT